jgi:hypothetical protein
MKTATINTANDQITIIAESFEAACVILSSFLAEINNPSYMKWQYPVEMFNAATGETMFKAFGTDTRDFTWEGNGYDYQYINGSLEEGQENEAELNFSFPG